MKRVAAAVLLACALIGCNQHVVPVTPSPSTASPGNNGATGSRANLVAATVEIYQYEAGASGPTAVGWGSGTIISPDGLILTNAHVAAPDAPGLAVQYGVIGGLGKPLTQLIVRMTNREDAPPVDRFKAEVVAVDGYMDIAVIKVSSTADGQPTGQLNLPWVELGDSDAVHIGDPLLIVGFPGVAGDTVSYASGAVSGFLEDPKIGLRGWIKTDATVTHGNSGGLAANAAGQIVGVPSRAPAEENANDLGGYGLVRPIAVAMPVINAARTGTSYGASPWVTAGGGQEQAQFVGWLRDANEGCAPSNIVTDYPSGSTDLVAAFNVTGFTKGEDYAGSWLSQETGSQDINQVSDRADVWKDSSSTDCFAFSVSGRSPFANGTYEVTVGAGPQLRQIASEDVVVGGAPTGPDQPGDDGIELGGRVVDATTGLGLSGAYVLVFKPGVDPAAWLAATQADDTAVLNVVKTSADGTYAFENKLPASTKLPLAVVADGYSSWIGTLTTGTKSGTLDDIGLSPAAP